ncbi:MAG TPA: hypothetical protein VGP46_01920 [Acidimicrobiales bacterium]|jgi:hypothetical protein|nr:hypothetical protein [Acidimicrobiales bacterium]
MKAPARARRPRRLADAGFTLAEVVVTMLVSMIMVGLVTPIFETMVVASTTSQSINSATAQARLAVDNLGALVGSGAEICLPTSMTTAGPTVAAGFAVRVESLAFGRTQWDQWMLNGATHQLQEQTWPTTWTTGNAVPPWVVVANSVTNTTAPFSLPTTAAGALQTLGVNLVVTSGTARGAQTVAIQSTIAAMDTPYSATPPAQACMTEET